MADGGVNLAREFFEARGARRDALAHCIYRAYCAERWGREWMEVVPSDAERDRITEWFKRRCLEARVDCAAGWIEWRERRELVFVMRTLAAAAREIMLGDEALIEISGW